MFNEEAWKDIDGFDGRYQVSNFGNIRSLQRTFVCKDGKNQTRPLKILKHCIHKDGYHFVGLMKFNKRKHYLVHRLVAEAFIHNPENKAEVNHIDGNKNNNCVFNLEWVTRQENMRHRIDVLGFKGGKYGKRGALNKDSKVVYQIQGQKIIAKYYGSHEAERLTGISSGSIRACCRGDHKSAGGYKWKYKNS